MSEINFGKLPSLDQQFYQQAFIPKSPQISPLYFNTHCEMDAGNLDIYFHFDESLGVCLNRSCSEVELINYSEQDVISYVGKIKDQERVDNSVKPQTQQLRQLIMSQYKAVITFFIQNCEKTQIQAKQYLSTHFPQLIDSPIIMILWDKFKTSKKTKQQLIKYCMRKAFKFVIQMSENQSSYLGFEESKGNQSLKHQKLSLSKFKKNFLKKISNQKSMNNKFLRQIFSEKSFTQNYYKFVQLFPEIVKEDNDKKTNYLAQFLANSSKNNQTIQNVQMIRRMPWNHVMVKKVAKIAYQLLKHTKAPPEK